MPKRIELPEDHEFDARTEYEKGEVLFMPVMKGFVVITDLTFVEFHLAENGLIDFSKDLHNEINASGISWHDYDNDEIQYTFDPSAKVGVYYFATGLEPVPVNRMNEFCEAVNKTRIGIIKRSHEELASLDNVLEIGTTK